MYFLSLISFNAVAGVPIQLNQGLLKDERRRRRNGHRPDIYAGLLIYYLHRLSFYTIFVSLYYASHILWHFLTFQSIKYLPMILRIRGTYTMFLFLVLSSWLLKIRCIHDYDLVLMEQKSTNLSTTLLQNLFVKS